MHDIALTLGSFSLTWGQVAIGTAGGSLGLLLFLIVVLVRSRREGEWKQPGRRARPGNGR